MKFNVNLRKFQHHDNSQDKITIFILQKFYIHFTIDIKLHKIT